MKKGSLLALALFLCTGFFPGDLLQAAQSARGQPVDSEQVVGECLGMLLNDLQVCQGEGLNCVLAALRSFLDCLSPEEEPPPGTVTEISLTNSLQFVLPDGSNNADVPLVLNVGDTVRWVHTGSLLHTVTSGIGSADPEAGELFDQPMSQGSTFEYTFSTPGTFAYFCRPHEELNMRGTIIVNPQ